jgi:EAL domain-containing protein (putative c-di-GMP-specific phosphodiesterase class I)
MPSTPGKCYIFGERNFFEAFPYMQTELLNPPALGTPWLEHLSPESDLPAQIPVEKYPFTIGRNESVDLRIDSSRVSREHAQIIREAGAYIVKDLQSTNGTFVNGNRVQESPLCDGDMLMVANEEFTFYAGPVDRATRMVTQLIEFDVQESSSKQDLSQQVIHAVRLLQEMLLQGSLSTAWQTIFRLSDGQPYGYEARGWGESEAGELSEAVRLVLAIDCRLTARVRYLSRMIAAEEASVLPSEGPVFVRFDTKDMGAGGMTESIAQLRELLPPERRLILALPYNAACNLPFAQELHRQRRSKEVGLAYYDFADLHEKALQQMEIVPDYLLLAKSVVRGLSDNFERQRMMQAIIASVRKLGGEIIALGLNTQSQVELCRDLGCRFGQGTYRANNV